MTFELSSENQNFGKLVFVTVSLKASEFFLFSYLFIYLFIYLFMAALGLRCCVGFL